MTPKQFETVLRVRRHRRDQVRAVLARLLADSRSVDEQLRRTEAERGDALVGIRAGTAGGGIDVDRMAALRYNSLRHSVEIGRLSLASAASADRVRKARAVLVRADQGVKAVERLRERREAELRLEAERRADREATDRFTSARHVAVENGTAG
jgi:flagellar export protein FliJ